MEPYNKYLNSLLNKNRVQFADSSEIRWLNSFQAMEAQEQRNLLTADKEQGWLFKQTKPYHNGISPGCRLCGQGRWSCLFITNKCNANCFYCPAPQLKDETPATQSLTFDTAESYAGYINRLGFKGVSFSGGEPLLFFERTLHYLKTVRQLCSPGLYIWMYTNGILASEEKFRLLAEAGLDEIRFDIGATGYRLDKVKMAKGIIPNVTIEIPAVPEKKQKLKQLLPEMIEAGVTNLNLHQLRLTKHNAPKLLKQNYTFIAAEQPVVLGSELAALEIVDYARNNNFKLGINYCSFYFKNRYQPAGFRKILAEAVATPGQVITEKGFIREYNDNSIGYKALVITEKEVPGNNAVKLELPHKTCFIRAETAMALQQLDVEMKKQVDALLLNEPHEIPADDFLFRIWQMEYIEKGLRDY